MSIALLPSYSASPDGTTLTVKDNTGQYAIATNVGGWDPLGVANPIISDATVAEVRIAQMYFDGTFGVETTVNVYGSPGIGLPSDLGLSYSITSVFAGQGGNFVDSIYRITYMVQGIWTSNGSLPFLANDVRYVPIIPTICACWQKTSAEFAKCTCNCDDFDSKLNRISTYMRLLDKAYEYADINSMQQFIAILTKLCSCGCPN